MQIRNAHETTQLLQGRGRCNGHHTGRQHGQDIPDNRIMSNGSQGPVQPLDAGQPQKHGTAADGDQERRQKPLPIENKETQELFSNGLHRIKKHDSTTTMDMTGEINGPLRFWLLIMVMEPLKVHSTARETIPKVPATSYPVKTATGCQKFGRSRI